MARSESLPREDLLHFVWKTKRIRLTELETTDGQQLEIVDFGFHNHDAGPDFSNGKVKVGTTTWIGHIEMHVRSSDWNRHSHSSDLAYDNVVLHVVYQHDQEIYRKDGSKIPTLELADLIDSILMERYDDLISQAHWIPCQSILPELNLTSLPIWLERLSVERLERKVTEYRQLLDKQSNDWDQVFHIAMLQRLGLRVNKVAFYNIGLNLPLQILLKHQDDIQTVEALLFGTAGYLGETLEDNIYHAGLKSTYTFLAHKYKLAPIDNTQVKHGRLRPQNLPTIRLAQYARLIETHGRLFSRIIECRSIGQIEALLATKITGGFWYDHYTFAKTSTPIEKTLGKSTIYSLIINLVSPMIFLKGRMTDNEELILLSQQLLEAIKPESNSIITQWKSLGINPENARESQALLQLKNEYCDHVRCLDCTIGYKILSQQN